MLFCLLVMVLVLPASAVTVTYLTLSAERFVSTRLLWQRSSPHGARSGVAVVENASLPSTLLLLEERNMLLDWIIDCTARQVSDELKEQARQLKQHSTPLTAEEKREIHEALVAGSYFGSNGHWYECPNGHRYFIGECGGAMEQGICNECGEVIGGGSHSLLPTNRAVANDL